MTDGGRAGLDAPYAPRGCDMRWYTAQELCRIASRFDVVHVIGDSMMRNLAVAMNTLLRADLVEGPHLTWREDPEGLDCRCAGAFGGSACLFNSAFSSQRVREEDSNAYGVCGDDIPKVEFNTQLSYPLPDDGLAKLNEHLPPVGEEPPKPHAFIFGHGLWDSLNVTATQLWLTQLQTYIQTRHPHLAASSAFFPRLFITPNAAGPEKHEQFIVSQGNKALVNFEMAMGKWVSERRMGDHLGTWNLTIQ
ncbi:MAG: hypothetical protein Q9162_005105, partial [Coniocarpon cinnabarinum]